METIRLIGRSSRLSLLQIDFVKQKIQSAFPQLNVEVIIRNSRGDALQEIPLHTVEGSDFFTQDIFDALADGEADIAVHSLKDMSSEHFFGENKFAVVGREDTRDIAIFNNDIEEKIKRGETIVIGTCSPRREEMATVFLKKALPQLQDEIKIETKPIRGNVETRLKKLNTGEYDATILAAAGLNRLLKTPSAAESPNGDCKELLKNKKLMLLPLIECVPAPCQGAIVAEAHFSNAKAIEVIKKINNEKLFADCYAEKKEAATYGTGCIQKFGVTSIKTKNHNYLYAAGRDAEGTEFVKWKPLPEIKINTLFSSTDVMKDFFGYEQTGRKAVSDKSIVFVANFKSVQSDATFLSGRTILASGTRTWFELAKQGYWVTAGADGLGFEFLPPSLQMPLFNISPSDITILTHEAAAERWKKKGYDAVSSAKLVSKQNEAIQQSIAAADAIFWSSYSQFEFYGKYAKAGVQHLCPGGETAALLKEAGIEPVIFPTIKAFEQWRKSSIRSLSAA
jgi:hydroxymethylbilane synthase